MRQPILLGPLPPPYGGVATFVKALVEGSEDTDIKVWAYGRGVYRSPRITQFNPRRFGIARLLMTRGRGARITDTSHYHLEYPHPALQPVWLASKAIVNFEWVKVILDGSLPARFPTFSPLQRRLFHQSIDSISHFIAVNDEIGMWLMDEIKVRQRVNVIPCLLPAPEPIEPIEDLQKRLGDFRGRTFRIVSSGTFIPMYGFDQIVEAVTRLRKESNLNIGLLLIDANFARDDTFRQNVLSGRDWITVLEGVDNRVIPSILRMSNLFVRGVSHEGLGISRVEALWSGVPVVATAVGETRGMATYQFGDVGQLAAKISEVIAGQVPESATRAAAQLRQEARANLRAYLDVIRGNA
jgi:glycosyltransferase involved in cell wall biosynthesis